MEAPVRIFYQYLCMKCGKRITEEGKCGVDFPQYPPTCPGTWLKICSYEGFVLLCDVCSIPVLEIIKEK